MLSITKPCIYNSWPWNIVSKSPYFRLTKKSSYDAFLCTCHNEKLEWWYSNEREIDNVTTMYFCEVFSRMKEEWCIIIFTIIDDCYAFNIQINVHLIQNIYYYYKHYLCYTFENIFGSTHDHARPCVGTASLFQLKTECSTFF